MHYLVGVSHLAKYDCMRNANKYPEIPYSAMVKKWKSDPESTRSSGRPPNVSPLARPAKFGRRPFPRSSVILFTEWQMTGRSHNLRLVGGAEVINWPYGIVKKVAQKQKKVSKDLKQLLSLCVCVYNCAQSWYRIQHRTLLILLSSRQSSFHSIPLHFIRKRQIASSTKQIYAVNSSMNKRS